jgi:hypothetical protein
LQPVPRLTGSAISRLSLAGGPLQRAAAFAARSKAHNVPFRHHATLLIEKRRKLLCGRSTLGTIVNGEPIGDHFRGDDAPLRAGENEVIAGGVDSPFVFSVFIT